MPNAALRPRATFEKNPQSHRCSTIWAANCLRYSTLTYHILKTTVTTDITLAKKQLLFEIDAFQEH